MGTLIVMSLLRYILDSRAFTRRRAFMILCDAYSDR